ncbi:CopK family periplasmic copper-binding protein [Rhodoferax sp.]|uniref:CopK family periplasmic copper-binding protein n=1 Tax=Rhodoferax sp. TaxID=50421 RepID=UPI00284791BA|nr:CopK family periplasmic copper-binding protein [Rhodoferax sp.]MDR3370889.1 CopK family periplasmic copper-binding protein [Rhodoferax sp.]
MSTFTKSALIATVLATASIVASAAIAPTARIGAFGEQLVTLQNGGTLHIYKNGTMAEENAYGRPTVVAPGQILHEKNGTTIAMKGDEVGRLSMEQYQQNHG